MIHYHGLPITPTLAFLRAMAGKHAMVSFEHQQQAVEAAEVCQSVALDNGAFSAWRQGTPYNFDGYYEWCGHWLKHPAVDWAIIPDVIDGDEEANERLLAQWPHGKLGVPVWHLHECLERLQWLCARWPRVALGSSGKYADPGAPNWWARMAQAMRIACDADGMPRCKLHGLRMLDPVLYSHIPFSSADSKTTRAIVMIDRIEAHASARRWHAGSAGVQQNMELLG